MVLTVNVPQAGTYDLSAAVTQARDYGIVSLAVAPRPRKRRSARELRPRTRRRPRPR